MKKDCLYTCRICREPYETRAKALACQGQPFDDAGWTVGEMVVIPGKWWGFPEGRKEWIAYTVPAMPKSRDHFDHVPHHVPWWVITSIHRGTRHDAHRALVTVGTRAITTREPVYGWNPANGEGHYTMYRADHIPSKVRKDWRLPPSIPACPLGVRRSAKRMAKEGTTSTYLL